jgi:hypothetical protein
VHSSIQISSRFFFQIMDGKGVHMGIEILDCIKGIKLFSHFHPFRDFKLELSMT